MAPAPTAPKTPLALAKRRTFLGLPEALSRRRISGAICRPVVVHTQISAYLLSASLQAPLLTLRCKLIVSCATLYHSKVPVCWCAGLCWSGAHMIKRDSCKISLYNCCYASLSRKPLLSRVWI